MGRKVFLSFLGTNDYLNCNYYDESNPENKIENVRFIQEALIQLYCNDFGENDRVYIFLTDNARSSNWEDGKHGKDNIFKHGLKHQIEALELEAELEDIDIKEGYSESDIWDIFNVVFSKLEDEDEVIFDITHGFRSLPMLGMVLLNYSKFLKNINLKSIYYGAFEKLGPAYKVRDMDIKDRDAPIIDLTAFDELQQWSVGADNFVNYGNVDKIIELIKGEITPIMRKSQGKDKNSLKFKGFHKKLEKTLELFSTIRGKEIIEADSIVDLKKYLNEIKENGLEFKALSPIIKKIEDIIKPYKENSLNNLILTVEFYMKNNQIQQAITLIQEMIITVILMNNNLPYDEVEIREVVSSVLYVKAMSILENNWDSKLKNNIWVSKKLYKDKLLDKLYKDYESLRNYRNSINHGGFISNHYIKSSEFKKKVKKIWTDVKKKLNEIT